MLMQLPETCCLPTRLLRDRATLAQASRLCLSLPAWSADVLLQSSSCDDRSGFAKAGPFCLEQSTGVLQQSSSCDDRPGLAKAGQCRLAAALQPGAAEVRHQQHSMAGALKDLTSPSSRPQASCLHPLPRCGHPGLKSYFDQFAPKILRPTSCYQR